MNKRREYGSDHYYLVAQMQDIIFENERLHREIEELRERSIDATSFDKSKLTVEAVADLHGYSAQTIRKYVAYGLIPTHPESTNGKILIPASDALRLNFSDLKKMARNRAVARR